MKRVLLLVLSLCVFCRCVYDFNPTDMWETAEVVAVEGDILVGDTSYFRVSSTISLSDTSHTDITDAGVWVEDAVGTRWDSAFDSERQRYMVNTSELPVTGEYKLCIDLPGRGRYESALMGVMVAPPIDSISYSVAKDRTSLSIDVTTHDSENADVLYCKWIYEEDWEVTAKYMPELGYVIPPSWSIHKPGMGVRTEWGQRRYYYCWNKSHEGKYVIASSERKADNLIYREKINTIYNRDQRLSYLYSILVRQTALNKEGYTYWETLERNTSETGGLFAPQPSELRGNVYSLANREEFVLGYVNVSTVSRERLFVDCRKLAIYRWPWPDQLDTVSSPWWLQAYVSGKRPVSYYKKENGELDKNLAWWTSDPRCVDCNLFATKKKPKFWPNDHDR